MYPPSEKQFIRINFVTIIALLAVILAGGIVRSTGSGMGCPDWPKCFDQYIPPTDVSQLPPDYKERYVEQRVQKNERFARSLEAMGRGDMADSIRHDPGIREPEEFNAAKTWTEYLNRLAGAAAGLFMLATLFASRHYLKTRKRIFFWSLFNVFLVGYQAWLGSIVVSTNLMAWIVTVHMLIAVAILAIAIYTYHDAKSYRNGSFRSAIPVQGLRFLTFGALILALVQITIGTEVREAIDWISSVRNGLARETWVADVGDKFILHRDLAIFVTLLNVVLLFWTRKKFGPGGFRFKLALWVILITAAQVATGLALSYLALPPVAQTLHILLATLVFGVQFFLFLMLGQAKAVKAVM